MNEIKSAKARQVAAFLRTSLDSVTSTNPGSNSAERAAVLEVRSDIAALLELYASGGIENPCGMLAQHSSQPSAFEKDPSRVQIAGAAS